MSEVFPKPRLLEYDVHQVVTEVEFVPSPDYPVPYLIVIGQIVGQGNKTPYLIQHLASHGNSGPQTNLHPQVVWCGGHYCRETQEVPIDKEGLNGRGKTETIQGPIHTR